MMIIGCDFHPSWQQVSWLDTETGECGETGTCFGGRQGVLSANGGAGPDWHGHGQQSVVHRTGAGLGARDLDRGCGAEPGQLCAQAEDGQTGRGAYSETSGGRAVSEVMDAGPGAARSVVTGAAPAQVGGDTQPGKKRTATPISE